MAGARVLSNSVFRSQVRIQSLPISGGNTVYDLFRVLTGVSFCNIYETEEYIVLFTKKEEVYIVLFTKKEVYIVLYMGFKILYFHLKSLGKLFDYHN